MGVNTQDRHPALAVKDACLARSGVYYYSYDEMCARGYTPSVKKALYAEYRPKEVVARAKDKFGLTAVTVEHTPNETDWTNFSDQAVGVVGDNLRIQGMGDGEIGIFGKMAFYTKDGHEYYKAGNKETSADYRSVVKPDTSGKYDFVLQDILSVNGVVLTARGRGGSSVRVQDSTNIFSGGFNNMAGKTGVLSFLGIGRNKDSEFKLSKVVFDGLKSLHTLDATGKEKMVAGIMEHITPLNDGTEKEYLLGAVKDSFTNPAEALKQEEKVSEAIDVLYTKCTDAESAAAAEVLKTLTKDSDDEKKKKDEEEAAKKAEEEKRAKDAAAGGAKGIEELFDKFEKRVTDSIGDLIDKKVQEALGVDAGKPGEKPKGSQTQDGGIDDITREEASFLLESSFGGR